MGAEKSVLFSDMDGTLLDSKRKVGENNRLAIMDYMERGGLFGIATGRAPQNVLPVLEGILPNLPCIVYNGSAIYDFCKKEFLWNAALERELILPVIEEALKELPFLNIHIYTKDWISFVSSKELASEDFVGRNRAIRFVSLDDVREEEWLKILMDGKKEDLAWVREELGRRGLLSHCEVVVSSPTFIELLPGGVCKGTTLKRMKTMGFFKERVLHAVGDYPNDIEMLQAADHSYATANALPEVKAAAEFQTLSNDEGAVADVLRQMDAVISPGRLSYNV